MSTDNILILGLPSGEHIMGNVVEKDAAYYVTDAVSIIADPDPSSGQMRMGFAPYMPYSTGGFFVPTAVTVLAEPNEQLKHHYCEKFGRIITPPTKIIT